MYDLHPTGRNGRANGSIGISSSHILIFSFCCQHQPIHITQTFAINNTQRHIHIPLKLSSNTSLIEMSLAASASTSASSSHDDLSSMMASSSRNSMMEKDVEDVRGMDAQVSGCQNLLAELEQFLRPSLAGQACLTTKNKQV